MMSKLPNQALGGVLGAGGAVAAGAIGLAIGVHWQKVLRLELAGLAFWAASGREVPCLERHVECGGGGDMIGREREREGGGGYLIK